MNNPQKMHLGFRSHLTLALCIVLHAFSHAYTTMLVPLYLLMVTDLHLSGVKRASLLVSIYGLVYNFGSYWAGMLADRFNRKLLLSAGLLLNAAAITLIGVTRRYDLLLLWAVIAGVGGTIFHPAAGALVPAHFPKNPGMAVGILGAGSGIGFFFGPQFSGWRAQSAHWSLSWINIAQWQKPCVEFGIAGIIASMIFQLVATEADVGFRRRISVPTPINLLMKLRILLIGTVLGCRDFASIAGFSLAGIYLLRARGFDAKHAGMILGSTMLLSIVTNPLIVWLTPLNRRLPALRGALILAGLVAISIPFVPTVWAVLILFAFQTSYPATFALSDAALLERFPAAQRGRAYGLYLTIAGSMGAAGPWVMGAWTDALGDRANVRTGYILPFAAVGVAMFLATLAIPLIRKLEPATLPDGSIIPPVPLTA
jgi:MFS family permease